MKDKTLLTALIIEAIDESGKNLTAIIPNIEIQKQELLQVIHH
jgi:hypothetical protein